MKIFISYRRDDSAGYAGRLREYLAPHFGPKNVFMDMATIEPGEDFREAIRRAMATCDVVLVMIGKQWLSILDAEGRPRLDNPDDLVRFEIATALSNDKVRVIPVLVRDSIMPGSQVLPDDLKELSWRNAYELSDSRFQYDADKLIQTIKRIQTEKQPADRKRFRKMIYGAIVVILFVAMTCYGIQAIRTALLPSATPTMTITHTATAVSTPTSTAVSTPSKTSTPQIVFSDPNTFHLGDEEKYGPLIGRCTSFEFSIQLPIHAVSVSMEIYDVDSSDLIIVNNTEVARLPNSPVDEIWSERESFLLPTSAFMHGMNRLEFCSVLTDNGSELDDFQIRNISVEVTR